MRSAFSGLAATAGILLFFAQISFGADGKSKLERLMEFYAANDNFNGTVLVARGGSFLLSKGYGYQDVQKKIKNTDRTVFQIGAISMQFTAELLLLLDSQGKLGLNDKLSKYLPEFPNADKISLKNLLTHTSGLYDYMADSTIMADPTRPITPEQLMATIQSKPLAWEPGTQFQFTNSNYVVLGCALEKLTRWNYEDQVRYKILNTCGMFHSGFNFTELRDINKAKGYYTINKDTAREAPITDSSLTYGGEDMYRTTTDLYKWHKSLSSHIMLPKDWQDIAFVPYKNHVALGWEAQTLFQRKFMQQTGTVTGFSSLILRQENDDVVIVLLQNCMQPSEVNKVIAYNIVRCLYDKDYKIPVKTDIEAEHEAIKKMNEKYAGKDDEREPVVEQKKQEVVPAPAAKPEESATDLLASFTGEYIFDPTYAVNITRIGNALYAQASGEEIYRLVPESNNMFYKAGVDSRIEFVKEESGKVNKIILHHHSKNENGTRR